MKTPFFCSICSSVKANSIGFTASLTFCAASKPYIHLEKKFKINSKNQINSILINGHTFSTFYTIEPKRIAIRHLLDNKTVLFESIPDQPLIPLYLYLQKDTRNNVKCTGMVLYDTVTNKPTNS